MKRKCVDKINCSIEITNIISFKLYLVLNESYRRTREENWNQNDNRQNPALRTKSTNLFWFNNQLINDL